MKRGIGLGIFCFSLVLILSLSLVSASFLGDLVKTIFGIGGTGHVVTGDECVDFDGTDGFLTASYVTYKGEIYYDFCSGNTAYDYYCTSTSSGIGIAIPLIKSSITGNVVGGDDPFSDPISTEGTPPKTYADCISTYDGVPCIGAGQCGCVQGQTYNCQTDYFGGCAMGTRNCNADGTLGACIPNVQPTTEICNDNIDNDCDGFTDYADITDCQSQLQCTDADGDRYSKEANPLSCENKCGTQNCLGGNDCNDVVNSGENIHPGATEICTGGIDEDCDGLKDCYDTVDCSEYPTCGDPYLGNCIDSDSDDYGVAGSTGCTNIGVDCNDNNPLIKPSVTEICDGIDNNCAGGIDEGVGTKVIQCQAADDSEDGSCSNHESSCSNGIWQACSDLGFLSQIGAEICGDNIDNNCDSSIDEGCSCTAEEPIDCDPGEMCKTGEQTCTNGVWSDCVVTGTIEDCNPETDCSEGDLQACGTNIGICFVGIKRCQSGAWGSCEDEIAPQTEQCGDGLDNDCDGEEDEADCSTLEEINNQETTENPANTDTSITGTNNQDDKGLESTQDSGGFFSWLWSIILTMFRVGSTLIGGVISEAPKAHCSDSDNGIAYFEKGTGQGLNAESINIWFVDACYKEVEGALTQVDKCLGDSCFLKEYYCENEFVNSEPKVKCKYGCVKGACLPDSSLSENCEYFDKDQWKWVNKC